MTSFSLLESRSHTAKDNFVVDIDAVISMARHLVIFDPAVDEAALLIEGVKAGYEVEILSAEQPAIAQISQILRRYRQLDTLHIVSHGRPGALRLGNGWLTLKEIAGSADAVMGWATALAPKAEVLFYGCELAKGAKGRDAIALLQELLDATVYAASTPVGTPAMGGQWLLETADHKKTTAFAFETETLNAYPATFSAPVHHLDGEAIEFTQLGNDINGINAGDEEGYSVSLSADGQTIVVSSIESDNSRGRVRIFTLVNDTWQQVGSPIIGQAAGDFNGSSVDISDDGNTVAIGAYGSDSNGTNSGQVRIFQNVGGDWQQIGSNIDGAQQRNESGGRSSGVSLSADGNIVAIGGYNYRYNGQVIGHVRVFENVNGDWQQRGPDIIGEERGDVFGWAVALSDDGNRLVTSGIYNDGSFTRAGHGRVFDFNSGADEWQQVGSDIDGEAFDDHIGVGVAISADGSTVSLGAPRNDANGNDSGHARVYKLANGDWQQVGEDIDGEAPEDHFGHGVKLSESGDIVAIATEFDNGDRSNAAEVYKNYGGTWAQLGGIRVKDTTGHDGRIVGLSEDGKIVAVTSLLSDGNGVDSGNVRVFSVPENTLEGTSGYLLSLDGLSITDDDFDFMKVSLSVSHGTLLFNSLSNVGVTEGANFSPSITIVGHIADINLALSGLSYESAGHFVGTDALVISSSDDRPNAKTTTNAIALEVTPAPQETAVNLSDGLLTFENSSSNTIDSNINISEINGQLEIQDFTKFFNVAPGISTGTPGLVQVATASLTKPIFFSLSNGRNELDADNISQGLFVAGGKGEDEFRTGAGRDRLFGKTGDDIIEAGAGNDLVNGGAGADVLNGGDGIDILDYSGSREGVQVFLGGNIAFGGHANGDTISGFEKVFGSNHDDNLEGDEQNNMLWGRDGDDFLNGRGGRDLLRGGKGNNSIDGGDGIDTVDYRDSKTGVFADLQMGQGNAGPLTNDMFFSIENVFGSAFDDELRGSEGNNFLSGFQGDDMLYGFDGNDTLRGGQGGDQLDGGAGKDTADYRGSLAGVEVSLDTGIALGGDAEGDTLLSIERLTGSQFIDTLEGDNSNNILKGEGEGDSLRGLGGADTLRGGQGADYLLGGGGRDTFDFRILSESLMNSYDVIGDLNANIDKIKGTQANAGSNVAVLGTTAGFTESEIADVLNTTDFVANGVATFKFAAQGSTLTFLALNDQNSGFQANSDALIDISGYTGSISNLTIV
ncbi:MAG: DUF4347 domain-containing protein [Cyanobacteria bacterium J06627_28]